MQVGGHVLGGQLAWRRARGRAGLPLCRAALVVAVPPQHQHVGGRIRAALAGHGGCWLVAGGGWLGGWLTVLSGWLAGGPLPPCRRCFVVEVRCAVPEQGGRWLQLCCWKCRVARRRLAKGRPGVDVACWMMEDCLRRWRGGGVWWAGCV
jgi:hypothetical protein